MTCPFCGAKHERRHELLNIICGCGSKYYAIDGFWLNRNTGERRYEYRKDILL